MKHMAVWLESMLEGTAIYFIDAKEPFVYLWN
jgi:hypothetical protein